MSEIFSSVYFGIFLSIAAYQIGAIINKKFDKAYTNPMLIGGILAIVVLKVFNIPYESFKNGGSLLEMLITPATVCLALSIYNNFETVKKNIVPIIAGTLVGSASSIIIVYAMCKAMGLDESVTMSLIPKSVTTPIAIDICAQKGGIEAITTVAVMISGLLGAIIAPVMIKICKTKPIESGLAIGTASHAAGTSKAVKIGEIEGALSGIAIGFAGIFTVIWAIFI